LILSNSKQLQSLAISKLTSIRSLLCNSNFSKFERDKKEEGEGRDVKISGKTDF